MAVTLSYVACYSYMGPNGSILFVKSITNSTVEQMRSNKQKSEGKILLLNGMHQK